MNFDVHFGYGGPFRSIPVRPGPFLLLYAPLFRDLGSKGKILLGSPGNYFQGSGEINALFSGIKGAQTPLGGGGLSKPG